MLYFIGLGLGDAKDISVKGLEAIKKCKRVYLEAYTSLLTVGKEILVSGFFDLHALRYYKFRVKRMEPFFLSNYFYRIFIF